MPDIILPGSAGRIEARLDSASGTLVGTCAVSGTGGWQTWTTVSCPVSGATGTRGSRGQIEP